jgi:superfamily II DNA or RNA helicase
MNTTNFKQFQKNLDATNLAGLTKEQQSLLLSHAKKNPADPVNKKIIHIFEGSSTSPSDEITKEGAENLLSDFPVSISGAWPGDILTGTYAGNKDMVIKIHGTATVYPSKYALDILRAFPTLWDIYLRKLDAISHFKSMSKEAKELWLNLNQDPDRHSAIGETCQRIEFLQPGTGVILKKIPDDIIEQLFTENIDSSDTYYDAYDVYRLVPNNPGSKAERSTLILFKMMWTVTSVYQIATETNNLTIDLVKGTLSQGSKATNNEELIMVDGIRKNLRQGPKGWTQPAGTKFQQSVGFLAPKGQTLTREDYYQLCCDYVAINKNTFDVLYTFLKTWPLSGLKSLLQKIIRFRADQVSFSDGETVPTPVMLMVTCSVMIGHAGSFVPDIQRYVTGLESFTKRLVVSTLEDSSSCDPQTMVSILAGSLLAQRVKMWKPCKPLVSQWFKFALEALASQEIFAYKLNSYKLLKLRPYILTTENNAWQTISALLDNLKSFETDLLMTRWIATNPDEPKLKGDTFVTTMPIWHCVDHHWAPSVAYFYESTSYIVAQQRPKDIEPYAGLFRNIFTFVTGVNFRRQDRVDDFIKNTFYHQTNKAQKMWYMARFGQPTERSKLKSTYQGTYVLDDSWVAGLIGSIDISGFPNKIATLRSGDIDRIAVIKKPSREMKDSLLTQEQIEQGQIKTIALLKKGIHLNKATLPSSSFEGSMVKLHNNKYYIQKGLTIVEWSQAKTISFNLPEHPSENNKSISDKLLSRGQGVTKQGIDKVKKLVESLPPLTLSRLIGYISTFQRKIELTRISRDGGGTKLAANTLDVDVFHILTEISFLLPGAIEYVHHLPCLFRITNAPLWWHVRDILRDTLYPLQNFNMTEWSVTTLYDHGQRTLWRHQVETIKDIVHEHKFLRRRGHFLWLKPGSGKTLIVLSYLTYLAQEGLLPPYIIYALPSTAISTIASEAYQFRYPVDLLFPLASTKSKLDLTHVYTNYSHTPRRYRLTLVDHDHLRLCINQLLEIAPQSIFVVDEVHKALNETKRTSSALELAHNSYKFVAMTGTPVIDNKIYKLIGWFDQIVDFEVNERNFWVAANSMLAKNMETGIKAIDHSVTVLMLNEEEKEYQSYVSPTLGGKNSNPSPKDHEMACQISLQACHREMIAQTLKLVQEGRGVMLVAKDAKDVDVLYALITEDLEESKVFRMVGKISIHLTTKAVKAKQVPDYRVVIVPIKKAEGYTLTHLNAMVTSVYPSNNATREQIRGRIDRLDQERAEIDIYTYHSGVLTYILHHHEEARRLGIALAGYSK